MPVTWLTLLGLLLYCASILTVVTSSNSGDVFTSSFLVRFRRNIDNKLAHDIASRNGFVNLGEVSVYVSH